MMNNAPRYDEIPKGEAIRDLQKVKLVIGNGFDLQCGMLSSYKNYFESVFEMNLAITRWAHTFSKLRPYLMSWNEAFWNKLEFFDEMNAWDCFFCLTINDNLEQKKWCDVETEMEKSFLSVNKKFKDNSFWGEVYRAGMEPNSLGNINQTSLLIAAFILHKRNTEWFESEREFFFFLLDELKLFEVRFGKFIHQQQDDKYEQKFIQLVSSLCDPDYLVSIDSFNYSVLEKAEYHQFNINGDYTRPIFGIDSQRFDPQNPRYIFTKTYRRIENDTDNHNILFDQGFKNVVVFGHSLCSHDYSYFFPLLDKLKMYDYTAKESIVFAYHIYDFKRESEIKTRHRFAIAELIKEYAEYRGIGEPNRLLDSLSIFHRIWIYELNAFIPIQDLCHNKSEDA